ncbi:LOW QUALITY PROTEIN: hypothetical protein ACHAXA_006447, partial [Cyclostephanos tholiformis]
VKGSTVYDPSILVVIGDGEVWEEEAYLEAISEWAYAVIEGHIIYIIGKGRDGDVICDNLGGIGRVARGDDECLYIRMDGPVEFPATASSNATNGNGNKSNTTDSNATNANATNSNVTDANVTNATNATTGSFGSTTSASSSSAPSLGYDTAAIMTSAPSTSSVFRSTAVSGFCDSSEPRI